MRLQIFRSAKAGAEEAKKDMSAAGTARMVCFQRGGAERDCFRSFRSSCPGLTRLRGRSRFGEAKARASTSFSVRGALRVDGRVKPGQDEEGWSRVITGGSASLVDQRAGALVREQFEQHGVLHLAVDDDDALHALFEG